jgi:hypothetical protein
MQILVAAKNSGSQPPERTVISPSSYPAVEDLRSGQAQGANA